MPPDAPSDSFVPWRELTVTHRGAGSRVDTYLAKRFPGWSRTAFARLVEGGEIQSTTRQLKPSTTLQRGEVLRISLPGLSPEGPPPPLPAIIHEDDRLIIFDKPAGLLVHPVGQRHSYGLIGLARDARPGIRLDLAHRLDRETSGLVVLTKDAEANVFMKTAIMQRKLEKAYLALVWGHPAWDQREIEAPLGHAPNSAIRIRQGVREDGDPSHTTVATIKRLNQLSLVHCTLHTGRTHQIRAHLEHVGHPVVGDKMYGQPDKVFLHHLDHGPDATVRAATHFHRHALHASELGLPHPDGSWLSVECPLPADLQDLVDGAPPTWGTEDDRID